ncbi:hypothetical protein OG905_02105 [Streptomyces sp. NBC_00322]|uniref:hypothetical protein n=1 Tax=Streptomyces sp. NBC_00322 TaxID=2975712 RepID=UPI002E2CA4D3|nr:hypothetical protein [Streptomyces sp. NBC_00322]
MLLVLTREHGGRTWRLADTCAAATPYAAAIPDTALIAPSVQHLGAGAPGQCECEVAEHVLDADLF